MVIKLLRTRIEILSIIHSCRPSRRLRLYHSRE